MRIKPFNAWRPPVEWAANVAGPPYDVVDTAEARAMAEGNPMCFLHVNRAEIDLPDGTNLYDDKVYAQARDNLHMFQEKGYLVRDGQPSMFFYKQRMGQHNQVGLVTVCHADDYDNNVIRKHEKTRKPAEDDRSKHTDVSNANLGPVFLAYRDQAEIDRIANETMKAAPLYDFTAPDGVQHTVWRAPDPARLVALFAQVPVSYIADGHHRAASGARVARERRAANPTHNGMEEYNWFMAVLFPAKQLQILPYNRCVLDLNGMTQDTFLEKIKGLFEVTPDADPKPSKPTYVSMFLGGRWYGLHWPAAATDDPVAALDVSVLQDRVLHPLLGIDDPRTSKRIEFVGGIRGTAELEKRVKSGRAAVAFSMYPTTVEQLMAIADADQIMPPKSTWFEPKLKSGLLVHTLDG